MNSKLLQSAAMAMIFLVVTLPFYVADVFAQDNSKIDRIIHPSPSGAANVSGFMAPSDVLTIIASLRAAQIPEAEVAQNVFAQFGQKEPFSSCEALGSQWYNCVFRKELANMPGGKYSGNVIFEAPYCTSCSVPLSVTVDSMPPSFSSFTLSAQKTNQQSITAEYTANDRACFACGEECSGIKKVIIYPSNDHSNILANIEVNQSPNSPQSCLDVRNVELQLSTLPSGNYSICIAGLDNVGNVNITPKTCRNLVIAREPPQIGTPIITDAYGNAFTYVPPSGVVARIAAEITSPYAELTKAVADLSAFQLSNQTMSCSKDAGSRVWECSAQFLALLPRGSATQTVPVYAHDDAGNMARQDFVFGIQLDEKEPELSFFETSYMFKDIPFFGPKGNRITLHLSEMQSGFSKSLVFAQGLENYFDVYALAGTPMYQASCEQKGSLWECGWPEIGLRAGAPETAILIFTVYDDTNNQLRFSKQVHIDIQPPEIIDISMHTQNAYPAIGSGENVVVRANISERSAMVDRQGNFNIFMDLTAIEGGSGMRKADSCELVNESYASGVYNGSQWVCSWIVTGVREAGYWVPRVNASDIAGNSKSYFSYPNLYLAYVSPKTGNLTYIEVPHFDILPTEEDVDDYWKVEMGTPTPASIDRQMLAVIPLYAYIPLVFTPLKGSPEILEVTLESCENDGTAESITLFPNVPDASNIELKILKGNYKEKKYVRYPCQIGIVSIVGGKITQKEIENVTIGVGLYNAPFGRFDEEVKEKVKDVYENVGGDLPKVLGWLKKTFDVLNQLCNIYKFVGMVLALFNLEGVKAHTAFKACTDTGIGAAFCYTPSVLMEQGRVELNNMGAFFSKYAQPACQFVTCTFGGVNESEGVFAKYANWQAKYKELTQDIWDVEDKITKVTTQRIKNENTRNIIEGTLAEGNLFRFWPANIQDSLILSMVFLCIPGVIYNLEKYRQIYCSYGLCMLQMSAGGGPIKGCEEMKKVQLCVAVTGEIFNLIPYLNFFDNLKSFLNTVFHDPASFTFFTANLACKIYIPTGGPAVNVLGATCRFLNAVTNIIEWITTIMTLYTDIANLVKQLEEGQDPFETRDICQPFIDMYEKKAYAGR